MNARRVIARPASRSAAWLVLGFVAVVASGAMRAGPAERESNFWPVLVRQLDEHRQPESWTGAGPLLFNRPTADGGRASGFRPFWYQTHDARGEFRSGYFLYPLFSYTVDENTYKYSIFELVRQWGRRAGAPAPQSIFERRQEFEVFPFWFSRTTGDPEFSYRALFPIYGTIKNKLGFERLSWTLFPLYVENEKRGAITTSTPWPIVRVTRGAAHGFGIWPLFNRVERPGVSREAYYLWPLGYNVTRQPGPDDPAGTPPRRDVGALPFYARSTGPGYISEDFGWPFFGYTDRTQPVRYHETRYFWPFLVQGRGDDRYVNRWGPFYTHSIVKGYDKTWYAWPLVRRAQWTDAGLRQTKTQFFYFLYWSNVQRSATRPHLPSAGLRHVWPLFSSWNNGAGRRQLQVLSPFEVFFPGNEKVRQVWTPLFSLFRSDQRAPGNVRYSLLWDIITWERHAPVAAQASPHEQRFALGRGLIGIRRAPGERAWRLFWLDFPSKRATVSVATAL
ncbi:MAG: hypothetical protein Q7S40_02465 [Opitutaceae bacterium]|nr:hypothetical protein [Opitutaceae bacterium]